MEVHTGDEEFKKIKPEIVSLRNSFGDRLTETKEMCNLLNYKFSQLGFTGLNENNAPSTASAIRNQNFCFQVCNIERNFKCHR